MFSILLGTHILPDELPKVLQFPMHLSKLTLNRWKRNPWSYRFKSIRIYMVI